MRFSTRTLYGLKAVLVLAGRYGEGSLSVSQIAKKEGISVLFTEHDMDVVFQYADRVIVLAEGALIAQGAPAEVRADARVRSVYLGE